MSQRDFATTLLLVVIVCLLVIWMYQRAPQPDLPLVEAAAPGLDPKASMIFAPCPLSPHNAPHKEERTA